MVSFIIEFLNVMKKCCKINKVPKYRPINVIHDNIIKLKLAQSSRCLHQYIHHTDYSPYKSNETMMIYATCVYVVYGLLYFGCALTLGVACRMFMVRAMCAVHCELRARVRGINGNVRTCIISFTFIMWMCVPFANSIFSGAQRFRRLSVKYVLFVAKYCSRSNLSLYLGYACF